MNPRKNYRVLIEEKRIYAIDLEAYGIDDAKSIACDVFLNAGFASGAMLELISQGTFAVTTIAEQANERTSHANR